MYARDKQGDKSSFLPESGKYHNIFILTKLIWAHFL
jgi:hypothetical protein